MILGASLILAGILILYFVLVYHMWREVKRAWSRDPRVKNGRSTGKSAVFVVLYLTPIIPITALLLIAAYFLWSALVSL